MNLSLISSEDDRWWYEDALPHCMSCCGGELTQYFRRGCRCKLRFPTLLTVPLPYCELLCGGELEPYIQRGRPVVVRRCAPTLHELLWRRNLRLSGNANYRSPYTHLKLQTIIQNEKVNAVYNPVGFLLYCFCVSNLRICSDLHVSITS